MITWRVNLHPLNRWRRTNSISKHAIRGEVSPKWTCVLLLHFTDQIYDWKISGLQIFFKIFHTKSPWFRDFYLSGTAATPLSTNYRVLIPSTESHNMYEFCFGCKMLDYRFKPVNIERIGSPIWLIINFNILSHEFSLLHITSNLYSCSVSTVSYNDDTQWGSILQKASYVVQSYLWQRS